MIELFESCLILFNILVLYLLNNFSEKLIMYIFYIQNIETLKAHNSTHRLNFEKIFAYS